MTSTPASSSIRERFSALPGAAAALDRDLELAPGDATDYAALCEHHYRAARPATMTRVLALRDHRPTVVGRYLGRRGEAQVVGVLVESMPALQCRLRDEAFGGRYAAMKDYRVRAAALNRELRCVSRVVIHPQWRGLGLAVRLVRDALDTATTMFTESLASMGHVSPFFEHAGMTAYYRPQHAHDRRLIDALASIGVSAIDLASLRNVVRAIESLDDTRRRWIELEIRRWDSRLHRRSTPSDVSIIDILRSAQRRVMCEPVYYLWDGRVKCEG